MASSPAPLDPALDLARFSPVNDLWPALVDRLGLLLSRRDLTVQLLQSA